MKRRKFVKISGIGMIGAQFSPFFNGQTLVVNPAIAFIEMFCTSLFGRKGAEAAAGAVVSWVVPKVLDWWFGDKEDNNCCNETIKYMDSQGYRPYQDDHKANLFYSPPPTPKPVQPSMPETISEYGAFTFTKKSPKKSEENTRMVFLAKTHQSKVIAAAIPESVMIAVIIVAQKLMQKNYEYKRIQQLLLPIANLSDKISIEQVYSVHTYSTIHGTFTLDGENLLIERDSYNIPIRIKGRLVITPSEENKNNSDDYFSEEREYDLSNEKLDFMYESLKLGKR